MAFEDHVNPRFEVQLALHAQIRDNSATASNGLEPKDLFLDETFASLWFVRFGSHKRAHSLSPSVQPVHPRCPFAGCAERPFPAAPAVGSLSSESTVPTLRRLWRFLLSASDCVCLPAVPDKLRHCSPVMGPLTSETTALRLLRINCHCHLSFLQFACRPTAIATAALYNSLEVCALQPPISDLLVIFMHTPLRFLRGRQGGRPTNKPARQPTK